MTNTAVENAAALPAVAIVSVTYNRCDALLVLLSQLRALDYPADLLRVFLVDNASADDTVARVRSHFPEVRVTESSENLGTSAGFNLGMRQALADARNFDYVWLLDSDAEIEPATLLPLVSAMLSNEGLGIVGSTIYDPSDRERLVTAGVRVNWREGTVGLNKLPHGSGGLVQADLIPACSLLVRSSLCREIGLWDERFWVYWGDTDWCLRAARHGYRVCGHLNSRTWHRDWANTAQNFRGPSILYDDLRGALLFNIRHAPLGSLRGIRRLLLKTYFKVALEHLTTRPNFSVAVNAAVDDFLHGRFERKRYDPPQLPSDDISEICRGLAWRLPARPKVIVDRIEEGPLLRRICNAVRLHFPEARFETISVKGRIRRDDLTTDYLHFLRVDVLELLSRLVRGRADVIVSEIASPHVYMLVAAKRGILLDRDARGIAQDNAILRGFIALVATIIKGVKVSYWDLPRARDRNKALRAAIVSRVETDDDLHAIARAK